MGNCDNENEQSLHAKLTVVRGGGAPAPVIGDLLTLKDVMALLRVGRTYALKLKDDGHLPCVRLPGDKTLRFRRADVEAFIERHVKGQGR